MNIDPLTVSVTPTWSCGNFIISYEQQRSGRLWNGKERGKF